MAETQPIQQETLPSTVDAVAASVLVVYVAGEQRVVTGSAALVKAAIDNPALAPGLYGRLRALASEVSLQVLGRVRSLATQAVDVASRNGNASAAREIRALERRAENFVASPVSEILPHNVTASAAMAQDLANRLGAAAQRITRFADDAYRAATTGGALVQINPALDIVHGVLAKATPAEAQAQAWRELTSRGITGFTDSAGREWNLASYVEMATRTATQRAYNASHKERLTQAGITYFTISKTGRPCPLCAPWEGKVLSDGGAAEVTEDGHTFNVSATIEEATAAGLFHPNCKHTLTSYLPGFTVLKPNQWTAQDEQNYKNTQRLRALEREVRRHKQVQAAALNDTQRAQAARDVRAAQAAIRDHVAQTGLLRRPRREQIDLGNK
jgi:hypothetical protein